MVGSFQLEVTKEGRCEVLSREDRRNVLEVLLSVWGGCVEEVKRVFRRVFKYGRVFGVRRGVCLGIGCTANRVSEKHYKHGAGMVDF